MTEKEMIEAIHALMRKVAKLEKKVFKLETNKERA